MQEDDEDDDDEDGDAPKRGQKRLKRSRFVDDIAAVDEEEDDEEEEVDHVPLKFMNLPAMALHCLALFLWMCFTQKSIACPSRSRLLKGRTILGCRLMIIHG